MSSSNQFFRADSNNLPDINPAVILEYTQTSDKFNIDEIRAVKALISSRTCYVHDAVGYVEVKRDNTKCILRAKVAPGNKVTLKKYYMVTIHLTEKDKDNTIIDTECDGCPESAGGCKHTLTVLFWLEKQTAAPSPSFECYWKKPRLHSVSPPPIRIKDIAGNKREVALAPKDPGVLQAFFEEAKKRNVQNSLILKYSPYYEPGLEKYSMFDMILKFSTKNNDHSIEEFETKMSGMLNDDIIQEIEKETRRQALSELWHSIRQGRVTDSKIYEICHNIPEDEDFLVEQILAGYKMYDKATKRGKKLEKKVLSEVQNELNCEIRDCGFTLINLICGAAPDGITDDFIVEVKCPIERKKKYVEGNKINEKYLAQCQLQMLATKMNKCAFCIADAKFENNKKIEILWIEYHAVYANSLVTKSEIFWKNKIYPRILESAKPYLNISFH